MKKIVFCHGFPFNKSFFSNLELLLQNEFEIHSMDLGYWGNKDLLDGYSFEGAIAVGHGIGFMKLLESSHNFAGYIGISTLLYLSNNIVMTRQINNLKYACGINVKLAVCGHILRLGAPSLLPKNETNTDEILNTINTLESLDVRPLISQKNPKMLFLHGKNDLVFDIEEAKTQMKNQDLIVHTLEGHGLGYFNEEWCANHIKKFINSLG